MIAESPKALPVGLLENQGVSAFMKVSFRNVFEYTNKECCVVLKTSTLNDFFPIKVQFH